MTSLKSAEVFVLKDYKHFGECENTINRWLDEIRSEEINDVVISDDQLVVIYSSRTMSSNRRDRVKVICACHINPSLNEWLNSYSRPNITHTCLNKDYLIIFYQTFDGIV